MAKNESVDEPVKAVVKAAAVKEAPAEVVQAVVEEAVMESVDDSVEVKADEAAETVAVDPEEAQAEDGATNDSDEEQDSGLVNILEALLLSSDSAISIDQMISAFDEALKPDRKQIRDALHLLDAQLAGRAVELREVGSGWRVQVRQDYSVYLGRLWEERPPRYSRALLETLALIVYRQPISRGEIEEIRGVSLSPSIVKTLVEREWVKVVGVREAPGRPELLGTTKVFLDDFNLKSLSELPSLPEIRDPDALGEALKRLGIAPEEAPAEEGDQADLLAAGENDDVDSAAASSDEQLKDDDFQFGDDNDDDLAATSADDESPDSQDDDSTSPAEAKQA